MIGSLRGELLDSGGDELLIEVDGIGYRVQATPATIRDVGEAGDTVFLYVHHHRREDAELLFGFRELDERKVFETLITTHGVGPSLGMAILSVHAPMALRKIIATEDLAALCLVPGVGKKTATRLLVELKNRLELPTGDAAVTEVVPSGAGGGSVHADVRDALAGLGYASDEISRVLSELPEEGDSSDLLRQALQRLAAA